MADIIEPADETRKGIYEWRATFADKWLGPDGSIYTGDGTLVEGPDQYRAEAYSRRAAIAAKFLLPDGSIVFALPGGGEGGGNGTINHTLLINRDAADQHPISAITGLDTQVNNLSNDILGLDKRASANQTDIDFLKRIVGAMEPQYVKDGLILHLDGINNTGNGHSNTASIWKNLAGDDDMELIVKSLDWDDSSIYFDNTSTPIDFGRWINHNSDYVTMEIIMLPLQINEAVENYIISNAESGGAGIIISNAGNYRSFAHVGTSYLTAETTLAAKPYEAVKCSMTYNGSELVHYNEYGLPVMSAGRTGVITPPAVNTVYGIAANIRTQVPTNPGPTARIYSVRVYDRALSADEIAYNAFIDRARFKILSNATP